MNAASAVGRIIPGYTADFVGRYNLFVPFSFTTGLLSLVLWINTKNTVALIFFAVLYGFFSGAFISLVTPCIAQISKV
ncbi:hypothetical protein OE88DRAFT_249908 [Heliocybe sulcata]|uniref:Major facilitator superfamily (MFS) profile domain-containing protein n=1 Tax=Heliocybe sulcata TaxID=5364 RepID=A0A5C3MYW7_9AGAM|nr:hypothetical protein OE88DRAFT_249908 [Heliocybe sulcata]